MLVSPLEVSTWITFGVISTTKTAVCSVGMNAWVVNARTGVTKATIISRVCLFMFDSFPFLSDIKFQFTLSSQLIIQSTIYG